MQINLIVIRTDKPKELSAFYNLLGMAFEYHQHGNGAWHYSSFVGETVFEIYPLMKNQTVPDKSLRLGFIVDNVDETVRNLSAQGFKIIGEPKVSAWGYGAVVEDLDGRKIELKGKCTDIWFTARSIFDKYDDEAGWKKYVEWSRLGQLEELASLDAILNPLIFEPNYAHEIEEVVIEDNMTTPFFKSIAYVKKKTSHLDYFNLLAVIKEPGKDRQMQLERDFDFIGYDLVEIGGTISPLTNCSGFDETFEPGEQNKYGLISEYERAKAIQAELPRNNPEEDHANCSLYEVWRHKFIGRDGSFNQSFCEYLARHLGTIFERAESKEVKGFWCDGILPKRISKKLVNNERLIDTTAWIGKDGQSKYQMRIFLGNRSLRRFAKGTSMIDCIPDSTSMDWIEINTHKKTIEIKLT